MTTLPQLLTPPRSGQLGNHPAPIARPTQVRKVEDPLSSEVPVRISKEGGSPNRLNRDGGRGQYFLNKLMVGCLLKTWLAKKEYFRWKCDQ